VPSIFLALGRRAAPCARAGGEVGTTAADTARCSYRRSPANHVIAAAAATTPLAHRIITHTRCAEHGAGSNKRLIRGYKRWRAGRRDARECQSEVRTQG